MLASPLYCPPFLSEWDSKGLCVLSGNDCPRAPPSTICRARLPTPQQRLPCGNDGPHKWMKEGTTCRNYKGA
eukprot:1073973-Amphidinium_carterae.1